MLQDLDPKLRKDSLKERRNPRALEEIRASYLG